jgi:hypothetical protein
MTAAGHFAAGIAAFDEAAVLGLQVVADAANRRQMIAADIGRSIIDDDDLGRVFRRLQKQAFQAVQRIGELPVDRNDDRYIGRSRGSFVMNAKPAIHGIEGLCRGLEIGRIAIEPEALHERLAAGSFTHDLIIDTMIIRSEFRCGHIRLFSPPPRKAGARRFEPAAARAATAVLDVALQTCDLRPQAKSIRFHLKKTVGQQDAAVPCVISGRL